MDSNSRRIQYNGSNFRSWKIAFEFALGNSDLESTLICDENIKNNKKALYLMMKMICEEKLVLLEGIETVPEALRVVQEDYVRVSPAVRFNLQQQLINLKFGGVGTVKQYLKDLEDIVCQYRMAGAIYDDKEIITKLTSDLGQDYFVVTMAFDNNTKFQTAKMKLIEIDEVMKNTVVSEKQALVVSTENLTLKSIVDRLEALALRVGSSEKNTFRFRGKCFNCNKEGHRQIDCKSCSGKNECKCVKCINKLPSKAYMFGSSIFKLDLNKSSNLLVLDSGATDHFCNDASTLTSFVSTEATVSLADGDECKIVGTGNYYNSKYRLELTDVKVVPSLTVPLMSVRKFTKNGYLVTFDDKEARIIEKSSGKVTLRVPRKGNLYALEIDGNSQSIVNNCISNEWHQRLGHPGNDKLKQLQKHLPGEPVIESFQCEACIEAKIKKGPFRGQSDHTTRPLELVHMDIAGPDEIVGWDGSRYFAVFVDDFTRFTNVFLLKDRTQVLDALKRYRQLTEGRSGHRMGELRSDQARELLSREFEGYLTENQIMHSFSTAYSHQQNGHAERVIQSVRAKARANLTASGAPLNMWPEAVRYAAQMMNLVPHSSDKERTPYEKMFQRISTYEQLQPFGTKVVFYIESIQRSTRSKWSNPGNIGAYLGQSEEMKAARIWDPLNRKIVRTCNLTYIKNEMFWLHQDSSFISSEENFEEISSTLSEDDSLSSVTLAPPSSESLIPSSRPVRERRMPSRLIVDPSKKSYVNQVTSLDSLTAPENHREAMQSSYCKYWIDAELEEFEALQRNQTFEIVDETSDLKVLSSRWVYAIKRKPGGAIERFKARLVARGNEQKEGENFWETYAATAGATTIRTFLAVAKIKQMKIHQLDVTTAFLNGDIDGEIYLRPPEPFQKKGQVWKLKKSLYGLKQAPRCWSKKLNEVVATLQFYPTAADPCVFVRVTSDDICFMLTYVDDLLIASTNEKVLVEIKSELNKLLKIRDLGPISNFLQFEFEERKNTISICQRSYIEKLADKFGLADCSPTHRLPTVDSSNEKEEITDVPYQQLVGALNYIANWTRPDISAAVSYLGRYNISHTMQHWKFAKQVLRYLITSKDNKLILGELNNSNLVAYSDASFAPADEEKRRSQSGGLIQLAGCSIAWFSRRQKTTSRSTAASEYIALSDVTSELLWVQQLLESMDYDVVYPTPVYEDCQAVVAIVRNDRSPDEAKHIEVRHHVIQDYHARGLINVQYVNTTDQLADDLTKVKSNPRNTLRLLGVSECLESEGVLN